MSVGGSLQWPDTSVVEYTNWEQQDGNLSMLSANSCFWVQSNTGLWKPGSCKNRTHGVICKRPRGRNLPPNTFHTNPQMIKWSVAKGQIYSFCHYKPSFGIKKCRMDLLKMHSEKPNDRKAWTLIFIAGLIANVLLGVSFFLDC